MGASAVKKMIDSPKRSEAKVKTLVSGEGQAPPNPPISVDDLVLRSVNFTRALDDRLRKFAYDKRISKSDIIRAALTIKLDAWEVLNDRDHLERELDRGRIGIAD